MKLKYYLRGLGTGILFASIVLFIAYSYRTTDSKIKEWASELGMVYPNETEKQTSKTEEQSSSQTSEEETSEESTSEEPTSEEPTSEETTSEEPTSEKKTDEQSTEQTTPEPDTGETETTPSASEDEVSCIVTVTSRTISSDVAEKLEAGGIIEDADDFDNYLNNNGYAYKIQNGTYTITKGMSYDEIAKLITSRNY